MTKDTFSVDGKIAIVTGSGRENGIGAAIARALVRNGAAVAINYVSESTGPRADRFAEKIRSEGGRATAVRADVSTPEGADKLVKATLEAFGTDHVDILVNNAGSGDLHSTLTMSAAEIKRCFDINLFAAINMVRSTVPRMPPGGRVINISSIVARMGVGVASMYGAAKSAQDSLTGAWAQEFGKSHGITVNSIAPGPVPTDINAAYLDDIAAPFMEQTRAASRFGTPEDIADIALFVASEKSRWLTGQFLSASGGITIN